MNILFIGDIVGRSGRSAFLENVDCLRKQYQVDMLIVNGENSAHGKGITRKIYQSFLDAGVDVVTLGNHTFSKNDIFQFIESAGAMVRPANMEPLHVGQPVKIIEKNGLRIGVFNLLGEVFMDQATESPFSTMERLLEDYPCDIHIVDFHGEATSEKIAFMHYFKDRVEMIVGTHTHVQTADEMVMDGCAYISDVGMCGAYRSVIGRDIQETLTKILTKEKTRFTVAEGPGMLSGVVVEIDEIAKRAVSIQRIQIRPEQ
ncbi:MAG: TIGR00282 family metallophosphoesterase [Erysipelotrichaceae bacterium]|nr:TIGR00282 family metallophosphoesterase [Erysipelotrichaceae bacterium]